GLQADEDGVRLVGGRVGPEGGQVEGRGGTGDRAVFQGVQGERGAAAMVAHAIRLQFDREKNTRSVAGRSRRTVTGGNRGRGEVRPFGLRVERPEARRRLL